VEHLVDVVGPSQRGQLSSSAAAHAATSTNMPSTSDSDVHAVMR